MNQWSLFSGRFLLERGSSIPYQFCWGCCNLFCGFLPTAGRVHVSSSFFVLASKTCNNHSHIYLSIVGQSWLSNIIAFCCRCSSFFWYCKSQGCLIKASVYIIDGTHLNLGQLPAKIACCDIVQIDFLNTRINRYIYEFVVCCIYIHIYIGILVGVPCPLKAIFETNFRFPALLKNLCAKCYLPCCSDTGGGSLWNYCWAGGLEWWAAVILVVRCDSSHSSFWLSNRVKSSQGCFW